MPFFNVIVSPRVVAAMHKSQENRKSTLQAHCFDVLLPVITSLPHSA